MKSLISTIRVAENSNKYDYNKMLSDFEIENRNEKRRKKLKNKWRSESQKYYETVERMKEKKEDIYNAKMNKIMKQINKKDEEIKNQISQNKKLKEEKRLKSLKNFLEKEKNVRDTYNKKLYLDEKEREEIEKRILTKCKYIIL